MLGATTISHGKIYNSQKNWHIEGNVAQKSEKEHWSRKPELSRNGNIGTENLDKTVKNVDIEGNEILQLKKKLLILLITKKT